MVNSKVRLLWRYLALIAVVGALAILTGGQFSHSLAVLAENAQLDEVVFKWGDTFETYAVGVYPNTIFPDPPWKLSGLEGYTYRENLLIPGGSDNQFLQLVGLQDGCGGSVAHRPIGGGGEIVIEGHIRNGPGDRALTGCHKKYGGIELSAGPGWWYPHRGLIAFSDQIRNPETGARTIRGGAFEVDEGPGAYLQDFNVNQWYHVRIHYKHVGADVHMNFWIDQVPVGPSPLILPAKSHEPYLRYIGLWSGEDFAWHDNVHVWATAGTDPGPYQWPHSLYLPLIRR
jgi:hypothetical protein